MSEIDPRPSFLAKDGKAEEYAKREIVGTQPCLICSNPDTVGLGQFSPDPEEREKYALKGQDPSQIGTIFFPLCAACSNEAPGDQIEFAHAVEIRLKWNAKRSKEV